VRLDVRPLDDELIDRLVRSWYRAVLRARLPDPAGWDGVDADAARRADALVEELGRPTYSTRRLLQLVSSPLLLTQYAADAYGFSHLGLQEYLAADHIVRDAVELVPTLAGHFGDDWWREVTLLALGLSGRGTFVQLMRQVAAAFCRWLAGECGRPVQLPSEAQWELAARGEEGRAYPWGDEEPDAGRAVFGLESGSGQPAPVGSMPAGRGPYGHLDLAGNVWEWCADVWNEQAYAAHAGREVADPVVQEGKGGSRALRSGGWLGGAWRLRSAQRDGYSAVTRNFDMGFRAAVSPASTMPGKARR